MSQPNAVRLSAAHGPAAAEASGAAPALDAAWRRYRELRAAAGLAEKRDSRLQTGFIAIGFLVVALSVLSGVEGPLSGEPGRSIAEVALIALLILGSTMLTFAIRAGDRDAGRLLRSGATEIEASIFFFATLMQGHEGREAWLADQVKVIRRRVFERLGDSLTSRPVAPAGAPPPISGDLLADEYLERRVETQIARQTGRVQGLGRARLQLQLAIFAAVGAGLLVAAIDLFQHLYVAIATAVALSLFAWSATRKLGAEAERRQAISFALGQVRDHWNALAPVERTGDRFMDLVIATEKIVGCLHDDTALTSQLAVTELGERQDDLLERIWKMPAPAALDAALERQAGVAPAVAEKTPAATDAAPAPAEQKAGRVVTRSLPHAFVVMPFGRKRSPEGEWIDFDQIYRQLIRPALEEAGFESFRADEENVTGDILTDMFQELLLADLVIADLSIDNANVFYELGVRHAMRKRGLIHIQSGRSYMPFDVFNVRTLPYHCDAGGKPDPAHLDKDRQAITQCARETWASNKERIHSPIFNLLDGLTEPDRRALQTPLASGYWRQHKEWEQRMEVAKRRQSVGDLLLLTEEASNPLIQKEAIAQAGIALRTLGLDELARRQYRRGLELNPGNLTFRREEAVHLGRLGRYDEAVVKLRRLLQDEPEDIEALFDLGELYENIWAEEFGVIEDEKERHDEAYQAADWLKKAIETYLEAYRLDQNHAWSGTKAYVLSHLLRHVVQQASQRLDDASDPEVRLVEQELEALRGAVRFTLESRAQRGVSTFGALVRLGYMTICETDDPRRVTKAFRKALTMASKNPFFLEFTLKRLQQFEALAFRPEFTRAGIAVFAKALETMQVEESGAAQGAAPRVYRPPKVFLFEGLEIDRLPLEHSQHGEIGDARFPAAMEDEVRAQLKAVLNRLEAGAEDLGITASASAGGDVLFIEECLARGMRVQVKLPLEKAAFIERSAAHAGGRWVRRFHALWNHPDVDFLIQEDRVGPVPKGDDAYERSNRWALYSALGHGIDRLRLILLWDGRIGDARGGAYHMLKQVQSHGGQVERVDTTKFKFWKDRGGPPEVDGRSG